MTTPDKSTPTDEQWASCTWEGAELAELRRAVQVSFAEKIAWLEYAHRLSMKFQETRRKQGIGTIYPDGRIEY